MQRVVNALYAEVETFIKWPSREETEQTMEIIENQYGFPGVIGAVDGTHIKITAPKDHSESYVNRKGFHSIQLQVRVINIIYIYFNIYIYILIYITFLQLQIYICLSLSILLTLNLLFLLFMLNITLF